MTNDERHALLLQLTGVVERNEYLEDENARLKARLEAQIKQSVQLARRVKELEAQRRMVDDMPTYVTVPDKECTGGGRDIIVIR